MSFPRTNLDQDPREPSMTLSMGPQRVEASNNPALNSPWSSIDSDASAGAGQWVMEQREVPVNQLTLPASRYRQLENRMHNIMPADCSQHHQKRQRHTVCKLFAEQARSRRSVNCFLTVLSGVPGYQSQTETRTTVLSGNQYKFSTKLFSESIQCEICISLVPKMNFIFVRIQWCKGVLIQRECVY
jgi:hypothetical protein